MLTNEYICVKIFLMNKIKTLGGNFMYCEKCGKEVKEGQTCPACGGNDNKSQTSNRTLGFGNLLCCVIGFVGALFTFPTFITQLQDDARWHGGIFNAIGRMMDNNFWLIPVVLLSTTLFLLGLHNTFNKK